jgi:hypothetical protein
MSPVHLAAPVAVNRTPSEQDGEGASYPGPVIIAQLLCWRSPAGVSGATEHC